MSTRYLHISSYFQRFLSLKAGGAVATGQQMIRGAGQFVQTAPQIVPGPNNTYINIGCQLISLSGVRQGAPSSGDMIDL